MKRHLLIVGIFMLAGVVVNVAVAWGCALWSKTTLQAASQQSDLWAKDRKTSGVVESESAIVDAGFGYAETSPTIVLIYEDVTSVTPSFDGIVTAGWPVHSLRRSFKYSEPRTMESGLSPPPWMPWVQPGRRRLPLLPIWPGFAVNTLLYAGILYLPFAPFALRRFIRRRRGLCLRCGYPRGASAVCTECGRDLPARAVT